MIDILVEPIFFSGVEMKLSNAEITLLKVLKKTPIFRWSKQSSWITRYKDRFAGKTIAALESRGLVYRFLKDTPWAQFSFNREQIELTESGKDIVDLELS